ncbi:hypothetical protein [Bradyrhizobium sp. 164]|uniref:ATP-dependent DNA ligase n=1 Tax=Bradyrhizobium sp. 164 TaxID=2782637 RepID=UPI003208DE31
MRMAYELWLATAEKRVPSGPDWIHEVKHDGYRMLVIRENERVRLFSRNGTDWTRRYPWVAEAALKNRQKHFVVDGEAVILGVDGVSDLTRCTVASTSTRFSSTLSTFSLWKGMISGSSRCTCARPTWRGCCPPAGRNHRRAVRARRDRARTARLQEPSGSESWYRLMRRQHYRMPQTRRSIHSLNRRRAAGRPRLS